MAARGSKMISGFYWYTADSQILDAHQGKKGALERIMSENTKNLRSFFWCQFVLAPKGQPSNQRSFWCAGRAEGVLAHPRAPFPTKAIRSSSSTC